jgi:type II secretory pathway pseudopilin PulG
MSQKIDTSSPDSTCRRRPLGIIRRAAAFTLVELLVVIGIIALLIGILLPSLSKARESANTVKCMNNMRQIYLAAQLYANINRGYMLPARIGSGSATDNYWCGSNLLADLFSIDGTGQQAVNRVQKFLACPSNTGRIDSFDPASGLAFHVDYTYNSNMGDDRAYPWSAGYDTSGKTATWGLFKQLSSVPQNVILAADAEPRVVKDDERFQLLADLTYKKRYIGTPHSRGTLCNILWMDGVVRTIDPWAPGFNANGNAYTQTIPMAQGTAAVNPQLFYTDSANGNKLIDFMTDARNWDKDKPNPYAR